MKWKKKKFVERFSSQLITELIQINKKLLIKCPTTKSNKNNSTAIITIQLYVRLLSIECELSVLHSQFRSTNLCSTARHHSCSVFAAHFYSPPCAHSVTLALCAALHCAAALSIVLQFNLPAPPRSLCCLNFAYFRQQKCGPLCVCCFSFPHAALFIFVKRFSLSWMVHN